MNNMLMNHKNWLIYTLLADRSQLTYEHCVEISLGYCKNICFNDYYILQRISMLINAMANNGACKDISIFVSRISDLTSEEKELLSLLLRCWFDNESIFISSKENINLYKEKKISFKEYCERLIYRKMEY